MTSFHPTPVWEVSPLFEWILEVSVSMGNTSQPSPYRYETVHAEFRFTDGGELPSPYCSRRYGIANQGGMGMPPFAGTLSLSLPTDPLI